MVKVQRANKQLTVSEQALPQFLGMGYSQIDENGKIVKQGEAKTEADLKAENNTLKAEIDKLKGENETLKAENNTLKAENVELKEANSDDKKSKK